MSKDFFGFNTTQINTLDKLLGSAAAGVPATLTTNGTVKKAATKTAIATANATDLPTAQALANDLKTQFNDLLAKLKTAGIMA